MGGYLNVAERAPAMGSGNSGVGRMPALDSGAETSDEFRTRLYDTIADAHALSSRPVDLTLPWEQPNMRWIFPVGATNLSSQAFHLFGTMSNLRHFKEKHVQTLLR